MKIARNKRRIWYEKENTARFFVGHTHLYIVCTYIQSMKFKTNIINIAKKVLKYLVFTFLSQAISRLFLLMARIRVQAFRKIENVAQKCSRRKKYEKRERKRVFQPLFILENVSVSTFSYFWQFFQWFLRQNKTLHLRTNINFCTKFLSLCRGGYFLLPNRE